MGTQTCEQLHGLHLLRVISSQDRIVNFGMQAPPRLLVCVVGCSPAMSCGVRIHFFWEQCTAPRKLPDQPWLGHIFLTSAAPSSMAVLSLDRRLLVFSGVVETGSTIASAPAQTACSALRRSPTNMALGESTWYPLSSSPKRYFRAHKVLIPGSFQL
jgi:hypothetical protein